MPPGSYKVLRSGRKLLIADAVAIVKRAPLAIEKVPTVKKTTGVCPSMLVLLLYSLGPKVKLVSGVLQL